MKLCDSKLIVFEGIPGSGKSSMAKRIYEYLICNGVNATLYNEGCDHPVDLTWHAYVTKDEFDRLITKYPEQAEQLTKHSIIEDGYILVPYRKLGYALHENDLIKYLEAHEVCYSNSPIIPIELFTKVFRKRWEHYAKMSALKDGITIFESALFQHHIHDLMRSFAPENAVIIEHLKTLIREVEDLNPVLFYLTQSSVKESLLRTWKKRNNLDENGLNSMNRAIRFVENSKYGIINNLTGVDGAVRFWEDRKSIEFEVMSKLPLKTFVIDNSDYEWDKVFDTVINILR